MATCGFNGQVQIYKVRGSSVSSKREVVLGRGWIERARWSPDANRLAVAHGKTLFILSPDGEITASFSDHKTSVSDFAWNSRDSREIATACGGGAQMWRLGEPEPFARFDWGGASLLVTWSPDGRWVVTGDQTPSVHLYDFTRDYPLHIQGFETKVKAMAFSPDATRLATAAGSAITVWKCTGTTGPEGTIPEELKFHQGDVETITWSPEGEFLTSGDSAGRLVFADTNGRPVAAFEDAEAISALAWSPDGRHLAVGDAGGRVILFSH